MSKAAVVLIALALVAACSAQREPPSIAPPLVTELDVEESCSGDGVERFVLEEVGDRDLLPQPVTAEELGRALDLYGQGAYEEAALVLAGVSAGEVEASDLEVQLASFFLAKAFFRLGYLHSSLLVAGELLGQADPSVTARVVPLLAVLAQRLPDPQHVVEVLERLPEGELQGLEAQPQELRWYVTFLRGRAAYQGARFDQAVELLASIPDGSRSYEEAHFFLAMTHVRQRMAFEALRAFQDMGLAMVRQEACGPSERGALRDLAALSIGRLLYGFAETESAFRGALRAYGSIGADGPHRHRATFERAWVHQRLGEDDRVTALLGSLPPSFVDEEPEVWLLQATSALSRCSFDEAEARVLDFRQRWRTIAEGLQGVTELDDEALVALVGDDAAASLAEAPPRLRPVVGQALAPQALRRARACLLALDEELRSLDRAGPAFQNSLAGQRLREDLSLVSASGRAALAGRVRNNLRRAGEGITEIDGHLTILEGEVARARRGEVDCPSPR